MMVGEIGLGSFNESFREILWPSEGDAPLGNFAFHESLLPNIQADLISILAVVVVAVAATLPSTRQS